MPSGIYQRKPFTIERKKAISEGLLHSPKAQKASRKNGRKAGLSNKGIRRGPKTQKQLEASRENVRKLHKLPKTEKQIKAASKLGRISANTIVEHHNDLCRGAERPDDVNLMSLSEHTTLHNKLKVENGTHHWLSKYRKAQ